jgi:hypothetical protein
MAKKSFAWNFPRPKQWQKKAWLKFSSTQNVARMSRARLSSGLDLKVPRELAAHFETFKIRHAGPMASPPDSDGLPVMP